MYLYCILFRALHILQVPSIQINKHFRINKYLEKQPN